MLLDATPVQAQQEEFAYEGLFDQQKQKDRSPTKLKGSRMDLSNFINPLNRYFISLYFDNSVPAKKCEKNINTFLGIHSIILMF